jgi:cold shock CspA family protein/ribosome-associated translation inhibitor RaiA
VQIPLQITFKGVTPSVAVETVIRERVAKLERYAGGRLIACRVFVQEPNRRHQQGDLFTVSIDLTLPGAELAVGNCSHRENQGHENVYVAIRDSFQAMERKLKDFMAMRRKETKTHAIYKPQATVSRLFPQDGYGFITTSDGREIYFHLNAVIGDGRDALDVGSEVRFTEELGDQGPQASTVEHLGTRRDRAAAS